MTESRLAANIKKFVAQALGQIYSSEEDLSTSDLLTRRRTRTGPAEEKEDLSGLVSHQKDPVVEALGEQNRILGEIRDAETRRWINGS